MPFSKGRLTRTSNSVSTAAIAAYDALGRVTASAQTTAGASRPFSYAYNLDSTVASQTYPSGLVVNYAYDAAGRPISASAPAGAYVSTAAYAPHGGVVSLMLGNGIVETTGYNNRLQPTSIDAGSLMTLGFGYGGAQNNGNVTSQTITGAGLPTYIQTYGYDSLNRLTSVAENGAWSRAYDYDAFGNRGAAGFQAGLATPPTAAAYDPATNRLAAAWAGYDAAGNLTDFRVPSLEYAAGYDAENRQRFFCAATTVPCTAANATAEYQYDGDGRRVRKLTATSSRRPADSPLCRAGKRDEDRRGRRSSLADGPR